jgi:hypothetical protein
MLRYLSSTGLSVISIVRVPVVSGGLKKSGNLKLGNFKPEKPTLEIIRIAAKTPTPA